MKEEIKHVLKDVSKQCVNCNLNPDLLYPYLEFNQDEINLIEIKNTKTIQLQEIFTLLQSKNDDVVFILQKTFYQQNLLGIFNLMQKSLGEHGLGSLIWKPVTKPNEHTPKTVHDIPIHVSLINFFDKRSKNLYLAQEYLRNHLKTKCEYIAKFWTDCLEEWDMSTAYVNLELLTNKGDKTGISLKKYEEVFLKHDRKEIFKRILIEGDPGYGKSTYANKIALDWANKVDEWLCTRFKFVFLFELKHLTSVEDSLNSIFPQCLHDFISKEMNRLKNETLFIFDGFDELEESKATYEQIQSILNIDKYPYVTCIVTSRRSHFDKIPSVAKNQRLIITGFTEAAVNEFMKKQKCPPPDANEKQKLHPLLTVPLFCTIYCSLKNVGEEQKIVSFFDLIQALVRSAENIHLKKQKQSAKDQKRDLNILGKFAISNLDSKSLDVIKKVNESALNFEVKNKELEMVKLGLLIKKKMPTGIFDEFKNEYSFAHQMIAEYFAAQYVSEITNLESINPQWLATKSAMDLPLVQFLLRIILSEWSMKNYNDDCVKSFLDVPEIYWTWICSQSEIALSQFICVRIWYSRECDSISTVNDVKKDIFDVSLQQSSSEHLKHDFLESIEKQTNSKITRIMLFRTESWFSMKTEQNLEFKLIDWIKPVFLDLRILDKNQNNSVNCEGVNWKNIIDISLPSVNIINMDDFCRSLINCQSLHIINLENCVLPQQFSKSFADGLQNNNFINLEILNLSYNFSVGQEVILFSSLHLCKRLKVLKMVNCGIGEQSLRSLTATLNDKLLLPDLENISFSFNDNIGKNNDFFIALRNCPKLKTLELEECSITYKAIMCFIASLKHFSYLDNVNFSGNSDIRAVPTFFNHLLLYGKLKTIKVKYCISSGLRFNGTDLIKLLSNQWITYDFHISDQDIPLDALSIINYLDVSNCHIKDFSSLLFKCCNLTHLVLDSCTDYYFDIRFDIIFDDPGPFKTLKHFSFSFDQINNYAAELFEFLSMCPNLETLIMHNCHHVDRASLEIFTIQIKKNKFQKLSHLDFSWNKIGAEVEFFKTLHKCPTLRFVNFMHCELSTKSKMELLILEQNGCTVLM